MSSQIDFGKETDLGKKLKEWWSDLDNKKGERAELRRAKSINEVLLLPCFYRSLQNLQTNLEGHKDLWQSQEQWAMILGLLSHIDEIDETKSLARQMADKEFSELRFRRLIQCDRDELYISLIRIIRLLKKRVNLYDLANSCYFWGDAIKQKWMFDYFT